VQPQRHGAVNQGLLGLLGAVQGHGTRLSCKLLILRSFSEFLIDFLLFQVIALHEVWHWKEFSNQLFADYINTFLRLKQQADGWPRENMTDVEKDAYIEDYFNKEGVGLVKEEIKKNPGLRLVAKLMLNTFWGKVKYLDFYVFNVLLEILNLTGFSVWTARRCHQNSLF